MRKTRPTRKKQTQPARKGKSERVSVSFTPEQYEYLNHVAGQKHVSIAWVIREAVDKLVAEETPLFKGSPA
jgi:hypothetical protein